MARITVEKRLTTHRTTEECLEAARRNLEYLGATIAQQSGSDLVGRLGSKFQSRLVGGMLAPSTWFPVRAQVTVDDYGTQRELRILVEENFGFGTLKGVTDKYRSRCETVATQLFDGCRYRLR